MSILIATTDPQLAHHCEDALALSGRHGRHATSLHAAEAALDRHGHDLVLLDMGSGAIKGPLGLCLLAAYRWPHTRLLLLLGGGLRADGSMMALCPNVVAYLPRRMAEHDLAAVLAHHAGPAPRVPSPTHPALHLRH